MSVSIANNHSNSFDSHHSQHHPQHQQQQQQQSTNGSISKTTNEMIQKQKQTIIKIYTDWANHYLKKRYLELNILSPTIPSPSPSPSCSSISSTSTSTRLTFANDYRSNVLDCRIPALVERSNTNNSNNNNNTNNNNNNNNRRSFNCQRLPQLITSLADDLRDGVLLIFLIESITDSTITNDSSSKFTLEPNSADQMIGNIENCIGFLERFGVNVNGINAKDIYEGNLKSILTLFFNISRHKQNLKRIAFHANQRNHQQLDQHQHLQQQQQQQQQQYRQPQIYERKNDTDQSNQRLSSASNQSFRIDPIATSPSASLSYTASCDEDENGFLTDFSISSSTQSLILNTGYDSFISKRMTLNDSSSKFNSLELGSGTIGSASTGTPKKIPSISSENGKSLLNNRNVSSRISQPGAIISNCGGIGNGCINTYPNQSINNATKNLINSSIPVPGTATNLQQQLRKSSNNKVPGSNTSSSSSSSSSSSIATSIQQFNNVSNCNPSQQSVKAVQTTVTNNSARMASSSIPLGTVNHKPSRPQSTSSIPQIGNISSVTKPAVAFNVKKNPTINSNSTSTKLKKLVANSNLNRTTKVTNGRLNPSQSEVNLRKPSNPVQSIAAGVTTKNSQGLRKSPFLSSISRDSSSSSIPRRPISTIIESSIPSMIASSSSTGSNIGTDQIAINSNSSITKPMATVKAMVTPIVSTSDNSKLEKKSLPESTKSKLKNVLRLNSSKGVSKNYDHTDNDESVTVAKKQDLKIKIENSKKSINNQNGDDDDRGMEDSQKIDNSSEGDGNSEDLESPPTIPPIMERPLQTISFLKANTTTKNIAIDDDDDDDGNNDDDKDHRKINQQNNNNESTPMIMYRKPENHLGGFRSGRSHYEPLYSNGKKQSVSQIHRLSQGADYYGSDNSDSFDETSSMSSDPGINTNDPSPTTTTSSSISDRKNSNLTQTSETITTNCENLSIEKAKEILSVSKNKLNQSNSSTTVSPTNILKNDSNKINTGNHFETVMSRTDGLLSDNGDSSTTKKFSSSIKDGAFNNESLYSNITQVLLNNRINNHSTPIDTDSVDSFSTVGSDRSHPNGIYSVVPNKNVSLLSSSSSIHHSKPGDLICEYEMVNRMRETMSASPTSNKISPIASANSTGIYIDTNGSYLGRSGSFRSTITNNHHHHHLPPIPAHLRKLRQDHQLDQQQTVSGSDYATSSLSLLSTNSSSVFTTPEEKYIHEIRRLRRELDQANEKIYTLTSQLTTNAHMVAAFEQSLSSMTNRLQQLSSTSQLKDCELERLRKTVETLKKQGGSLVGHAKSATINHGMIFNNNTNDHNHNDVNRNNKFNQSEKINRYLSSESVNSVSSCGDGSNYSNKNKKKTKIKLSGNNTSWIRSSFNRAFKKKSPKSIGRDVSSDIEHSVVDGETRIRSVPSSPLLSSKAIRSLSEEPEELRDLRKQLREKEMQLTDMRLESLTSAHQLENLKEIVNQMRMEMMNLKQDNDRLQRLANHKSLASSQSSMTSAFGSHGSSTLPSTITSTMPAPNEDSNSFESVEMDTSPLQSSTTSGDFINASHKIITLGSGSHLLATLNITTKTNWDQLDVLVKKCFKEHLIRVDSSLSLGITVDSLACYCVGAEKIQRNFFSMNQSNCQQSSLPELLPFGYLINENHINLQFKSPIDSLAFDTLTPKSVLNEFVTMLANNRRLIFTGPSGVGKTFLAHRIAEYLSIKQSLNPLITTSLSPNSSQEISLDNFDGDNRCPTGSIATFNIDHKNSKQLRAYLTNIIEQCQIEIKSMTNRLPTVIILDNLHCCLDSLEEILTDLHRINSSKSPYIIGTINQNTSNNHITSLLQQFNFRWVMLSVNSEAIKGYLNRFLRRKLLETEIRFALNNQKLSPETVKIVDWISKIYVYLNRFLQNYFGDNISIGPRLFTPCPIDVNGSQAWFTDLWNYSLLPFIIENFRERLKQNNYKTNTGSNRNSMIDPTDWIIANYPWSDNSEWSDHLNRLRPEDLEEENQTKSMPSLDCSIRNESNENKSLAQRDKNIPSVMDSFDDSTQTIKDPFLQMLLKLKEASEFSSQDVVEIK